MVLAHTQSVTVLIRISGSFGGGEQQQQNNTIMAQQANITFFTKSYPFSKKFYFYLCDVKRSGGKRRKSD